MDDMVIPTPRRSCSSARRRKRSRRSSSSTNEGLITDGERYNKVVDIWAEVAERSPPR
jgi:DNA-directed RNA polymerase subunit beta'